MCFSTSTKAVGDPFPPLAPYNRDTRDVINEKFPIDYASCVVASFGCQSGQLTESKRDNGIERKDDLVFSVVKWPMRLIEAICPVVANIGTEVQLLHQFPV